jgi:hypothetical protein
MRLSMARTPATAAATRSALARSRPLLDIPASVILPSAADTVSPTGAMPGPISSPSAELILASRSLSASAQRVFLWSRKRGCRTSSQTILTQASTVEHEMVKPRIFLFDVE